MVKVAQVGQKNTITFRNSKCPSAQSICSVDIIFWSFINRREYTNGVLENIFQHPDEKFSKLRGDPVNGNNLFWTGYYMGENLRKQIKSASNSINNPFNDQNYFNCHDKATNYYQDPAYLKINNKTEKCSSSGTPSSHYPLWSNIGVGSQVQFNGKNTDNTGLSDSRNSITITKDQFINLLYAQAAFSLNGEQYNSSTNSYNAGFPKCLPKTTGCNNKFTIEVLNNKILGVGKSFATSAWMADWIIKKAAFGHELFNEGEDDGDKVFIGGNLTQWTMDSF